MKHLFVGILLIGALALGCSHPRILVYYEDGDSSDFKMGSAIVVPSPTPPQPVLPQ